MAFFPISIFFEALFLLMSLWLLERGLLSRFAALVLLILEVPLISIRQVYVVESSGVITQPAIFLPLLVSQILGSFFTIMAYIAVASIFKFMGRDPLGRKPIAKP